MSKFSFDFNGKTFEINGPTGLTKEQAADIFNQQSDAGSLLGLKPGDALDAAKQAAAGLPGALSQVGQKLSGITGALGAGIPGAAGAIGSLTQAAGAAGGLAAGALATVNKAVGSVASASTIGLADFAKQAPALTGISSMSLPDVTSVLAQAKKTVGQASTAISNSLGAGEFGLNVSQLESAGIVKPGTNGLITAGSSLTDVLKSPAVFTGKDGINSLDNFLSSSPAQSKTMQDLMSSGLNNLSAAGIPTDKLPAQITGGLALGATAVAGALGGLTNALKGAPTPADLKAKLDQGFADASAAISLGASKIPAAFKAEVVPEPTADTVNRETVTGAVTRILGNPKIPAPNFAPVAQAASELANSLTGALGKATSSLPGSLTGALNQATSGLTGALNQATSGVTGALPGSLTGALNQATSGVTGALTGALGTNGSVATNAVAAIKKSLG
jgi:hypothetical protein